MSIEENKSIVRRWFEEVVNQGNMQTMDLICAQCHPQFAVIRGVAEPAPQGMTGLKALIQSLRSGFPDLQMTIEEQIAEDNKVASRMTISGTHKGEIFGLAPTGKSFSIGGVSIWEVRGGFLITESVSWDTFGMMQQLGVLPAPGQAAA